MTAQYRSIISKEISKLNAKIDIRIVRKQPYGELAAEHKRLCQLLASR